MPDQDATLDEAESTAEVMEPEPTEVTPEVVHTEDEGPVAPESTRGIVIRHVLERQLVAGQGLSTQLVDAATIRIVTEETAFENRGKDDGLPVPDKTAGLAVKGAGDAFEFPRHQTAPTGMPGIFNRVRNTQLRVVM